MIKSSSPAPTLDLYFSNFTCNTLLTILLLCIVCLAPSKAFTQESAIGRVILTQGRVEARSENGEIRPLSRRSEVFEQDTVLTGPNGFTQIRLMDEGMIAFKANTEFTFHAYESDGVGGDADNALMELVRGGFRTISGTIGDDDNDQYEIQTQFASIGIRGTTHEAVIDSGSLFTGVYNGGTSVSNAFGSLDLGNGANYDFSQTLSGEAPVGLLQQPSVLGNISLGGDDDEDESGDDDDSSDGDSESNESSPPPPNNDQGGPNDGAGNSANFGTNDGDINPVNNVRDPEDLETAGLDPEDFPPEDNSTTPTNPNEGTGTSVISEEEIQTILDDGRVGLTFSSSASPNVIFAGNTNNVGNGESPILLNNDPSTPELEDPTAVFIQEFTTTDQENINTALVQQPSFLDGIDSFNVNNNNITHDVQWGIWGGIQGDLYLYPDLNDSTDSSIINTEMLFLSVLPTTTTQLAALSGTYFYTNPYVSLGGVNGQLGFTLRNFEAVMTVDFGNGLIENGIMLFCVGGNSYSCNSANGLDVEFDFEGVVAGSFLDASPIENSAEINNEDASIAGSIQGYFTGENAEAFAGGFNLSFGPSSVESFLPSNTLEGLFILEREDRLNAEQISNFDHDETDQVGFGLFVQERYARALQGLGLTTDGPGSYTSTNNDSLLFIDLQNWNVYAAADNGPVVIDQYEDLYENTGFDVTWERWTGPVNVFTDNFDNSVFESPGANSETDVAFFAIYGDPTSQNNLQGKFNHTTEFIGQNGDGQTIDYLNMEFDVDFLSGEILNGSVNIISSVDTWNVHYQGFILDNKVEIALLQNPGNQPFLNSGGVEYTWNDDTLQGDINGTFIDNDDDFEQAFLSNFWFKAFSDTHASRSVSGIALTSGTPENRFTYDEQSALTNYGMVLASHYSETDAYGYGYIIPSIASDPFIDPNTGFTYGPFFVAAPENYLQMLSQDPRSEIFVETPAFFRGDAVLEDFMDGSATYDYDFYWGLWSASSSLNSGPIVSDDNQFASASSLSDVVWASINDVALSTPTGLFTYGRTLDYIGTSSNGDITELFVTFDVDFNTALVSDGQFIICTGGSSGCNDATTWLGEFEGFVTDGYFSTSSGITNGTVTDSDSAVVNSTEGDINGVFISAEDVSSPADAFVGGINLENSSDTSQFVTTAFLLEREERFDNGIINPSLEGATNILTPFITGPEVALISYPGAEPGIKAKGSANLAAGYDILFPEHNFEKVFYLGNSSTGYPDLYFSDLENSCDGPCGLDFTVQIGYWNDNSNPALILSDNFDSAQSSTLGSGTDIAFVNVTPFIPTQQTGFFHSYSSNHYGETNNNDLVDYFEMGFIIDFESGLIYDGWMYAQDQSNNTGAGFSSWDIVFDGTAQGAHVEFDNISGTHEETPNSSTLSTLSIIDTESSIIQGIFAPSQFDDESTFAGTYYLKDLNSEWINGVYMTSGLIEDRLSGEELQASTQNLGLLFDSTGSVNSFGFGTTGFDATAKFSKPNSSNETFPENGESLLEDSIDYVLSNTSTGIQTNIDGFNVGWGYWNTDPTKQTDLLNGETLVIDSGSEVERWLSAQRTTENIADLSGTYSYSSIGSTYAGNINGNSLSSFAMSFDVDFFYDSINNGSISASDGTNNWSINGMSGYVGGYLGSIDASTGSGTVNGSTSSFSGSIDGVFTGSASNPGFAAGFEIMGSGQELSGFTMTTSAPRP